MYFNVYYYVVLDNIHGFTNIHIALEVQTKT